MIFVFFMVLGVLFFIAKALQDNEASLTDEEKIKRVNKFDANYLGGLRGLSFSQPFPVKIYIHSDKIIIKCNNLEYNIDFEKIVTFDIQTEHSISKDITLTRLVSLGVFAFAFKKKKTNVENYFVLKYKQDNEEKAVILEGMFVRKIDYELRFKYDNYKKLSEVM